ncbi:PatB family C-S lyase [Niveibacterium sp. SC-1]|uniref:MalY/PatB family protein n=1 Tax=Niveibacterium sp. SC-1 TaxID=3135646 RepID=UPI00311DC922
MNRPPHIDFDFDTPLPLATRGGLKWSRYAGRDVVPMWVADMDFAAPPPVLARLAEEAAFGHFGYRKAETALVEATLGHLEAQYGWKVAAEWLVWLPGLVVGLNLAVRAATRPDQAVFTATPVYPPFLSAPGNAERALRTQALRDSGSAWEWDFDALATQLPGCGLWLLCSPHNPVGRAWREDELTRIGELALRHDLVVCADEIHCDLLLAEGARHRPFASLSPDLAARSITLMAPSKTFNVPGLGAAFAVIPDAGLRARFKRTMAGLVPEVNALGFAAMEVALRDCEDWRQALLAHIRQQARRVEEAVEALSGLSMRPVEATYLAWIDCRDWMAARGVANAQRHFEEHGLGLSDGADFGAPGFVRLNFGCPGATLEEGLRRLRAAHAAA